MFFLGCLEAPLGGRVTVYSQQARALNLTAEIIRRDLIGQDSKIAVIGGGISGITAAAALAMQGVRPKVRIYEQRDCLVHLQQRSPDRFVHPNIYNWPHPNSLQKDANLPILSWTAGSAGEVASQCLEQFDAIANEYAIEIILEAKVIGLETLEHEGVKVTSSAFTSPNVYDIVIIAVGFGYEREIKGENESYWSSSRFVGSLRTAEENPLVFISGNGDGGLVDFAMAAFNGFNHIEICEAVVSFSGLEAVEQAILQIDAQALGNDKIDIFSEYDRILPPLLPRGFLLRISELLRPNVELIFHTSNQNLFRQNTAPLNRFIAWLAITVDRNIGRNATHTQTGSKVEKWSTSHIEISGGSILRPHAISLRLGTNWKCNIKPFQQLASNLLTSLQNEAPRIVKDEELDKNTWDLLGVNQKIPLLSVENKESHSQNETNEPSYGQEALEKRFASTPNFATSMLGFLRLYDAGSFDLPVFVGRRAELETLSDWLEDPNLNKCLLTAPAGRGKSSLLVHWAGNVSSRIETLLVPVSLRFGTNSTLCWSEALYRALLLHFSKKQPHTAPPLSETHYIGLIHEILSEQTSSSSPLLLILDGVDESSAREALSYLFPNHLPKGVKVVVSAREIAAIDSTKPFDWMRHLRWKKSETRALSLTEMTPSDVLLAVKERFSDRVGPMDRITASNRVWKICDKGDPLLVNLFIQEIENRENLLAQITLVEEPSFKPGYEGLISRWIDDQVLLVTQELPLEAANLRKTIPLILLVLSKAKDSLTASDIAELLQTGFEISILPLSRLMSLLDRLVIATDEGYVLCHSKIGQYVLTPSFADIPTRIAADRSFEDWCLSLAERLQTSPNEVTEVSNYQVRWAVEHLVLASTTSAQLQGFVTPHWLGYKRRIDQNDFGFGRDISKIRDLALDEVCRIEEASLDTSSALRLAYNCALILTSIVGATKRLPPPLIARCVASSTLSEYEAVHLLNNMEPHEFSRAFAEVEPQLSDSSLDAIIGHLNISKTQPDYLLCQLAFLRREAGKALYMAIDAALDFAFGGNFQVLNDRIEFLERVEPFASIAAHESYYRKVFQSHSFDLLGDSLLLAAISGLPDVLWDEFGDLVFSLLRRSGSRSIRQWCLCIEAIPKRILGSWAEQLCQAKDLDDLDIISLAVLSDQVLRPQPVKRRLAEIGRSALPPTGNELSELLSWSLSVCPEPEPLASLYASHPDHSETFAIVASRFFDERSDGLINKCIDSLVGQYRRSWLIKDVLAARPSISLPDHMRWIAEAASQDDRAAIVSALAQSNRNDILSNCLSEIDNLGDHDSEVTTSLSLNTYFQDTNSLLINAKGLRDGISILTILSQKAQGFSSTTQSLLAGLISEHLNTVKSSRELVLGGLIACNLRRYDTTTHNYCMQLKRYIESAEAVGIREELERIATRLHLQDTCEVERSTAFLLSNPRLRACQFLSVLSRENGAVDTECLQELSIATEAISEDVEISHLADNIVLSGPNESLQIALTLLERLADSEEEFTPAEETSDNLSDTLLERIQDPVLISILRAGNRQRYDFQRERVAACVCRRLGGEYADVLLELVRRIGRPQGIAWAIADSIEILIKLEGKLLELADQVASGSELAVEGSEFYQAYIYGEMWPYANDKETIEVNILRIQDPVARARAIAKVRIPISNSTGTVQLELKNFYEAINKIADRRSKFEPIGAVCSELGQFAPTILNRDMILLASESWRVESVSLPLRAVKDEENFLVIAKSILSVLKMYS
ncbi:MAG: NAD(P)-binding protein [Pseudomonadota bacterium]